MTKSFFAILSVSALALTACADNGSDQADGAEAASITETAASETSCTQENMQEKATELATKMQGLAGDPDKMQELSAEMMEIQKKVQDSASDGSYSLQDACDAYDALLKL
ncbi:MAG: hypothetical protein ABJP02_10905 [Parasphingorhabdus sp.]|uniref:hypothetical protein n=1 Tax=Parasphingorhabdus sp. TaxID=2709688 RepID=UPI00329A0062